jgi:hypothetical protein
MISLRSIIGWLGFGGLVLVELARSASAQVFQQGGVLPQHMTMWSTNNTVMDAGGVAQKPKGLQPYELAIVAPPNKSGNPFPAAASGAGPNGENFCIYDTPLGIAGHYLCFSPNVGGGMASLGVGALGGAGPSSFQIILNGVSYSFPGPGNGNVIGPTSPTAPAGEIVRWNGGLTVAPGGVLTGTVNNTAARTVNGYNFLFRDSTTAVPSDFTGNSNFDGVASIVSSPAGTTVLNTTAFAAYVDNLTPNIPSPEAGNAVAFYGVTACNVNGAFCWGVNATVNDSAGHTGILLQNEFDMTIISTSTKAYGVVVTGASTAQAADSAAYVVASPSIQNPGLTKWVKGLWIEGASSQTAISIGGASPSGINIPGMPIELDYFNNVGAPSKITMGALANGQLAVTNLAGAVQTGLSLFNNASQADDTAVGIDFTTYNGTTSFYQTENGSGVPFTFLGPVGGRLFILGLPAGPQTGGAALCLVGATGLVYVNTSCP